MFIFVAIYSFIVNVAQRKKGDAWVHYEKWSSKAGASTGSASYITWMSLGNFGMNDKEYEDWEMWLLLALSGFAMVVILILNIFYWWYQHNVEKKIDEANITPSDFTLFVTNIPIETSPEDLLEFFRRKFWGIEFIKANYCYKIGNIVKLVRRQDKLQGMLNYIESYKKNFLKWKGIS